MRRSFIRNVMHVGYRVLSAMQVPRNFVWGWCHGLTPDAGWRIAGLPFVRRGGIGSTIKIGKRFQAVSRLQNNCYGIIQRVMIRTIGHGASIVIGDNVGVSGCTISAARSVTIGDNVLIGSGVVICDTDAHAINPAKRDEDGGLAVPIVIEDDVFIGARAMILKGVRLGRGCVVGAGAIVAKDVPEYAIVVGNPARIVGDSREK